jgi:hypothetical protein
MHVAWWVRSGKATTALEGKLLVTSITEELVIPEQVKQLRHAHTVASQLGKGYCSYARQAAFQT